MRTTLTIDDDVLSAVRERAADDGLTIGQMISSLVRASFITPSTEPAECFYGFRPLPKRGGIVTSEMINAIREADGI